MAKDVEFDTFKKFTEEVAAGREPAIVGDGYIVISLPVYARIMSFVPEGHGPDPNRTAVQSKNLNRVDEIVNDIKTKFGPKEGQ